MPQNFERSLPFTLQWEGGYVNNPADPGGATNRGVTQNTYNQYLAGKGRRAADVRAISDAEVSDIYRSMYWAASQCDAIAWALCAAHFDTAVNTGPKQAAKLLQRAVGVADDGAIGPETLAAVAAANPQTAVATYCDKRAAFYDALIQNKPSLATFRAGWMHRVSALRAFCGVGGPISFGPSDEPEPTESALAFVEELEAQGIQL